MIFRNQDDVFKRGRPPKYPWDLWTDGKRHVARKGLDFQVDTQSFTSSLYDRAKRTDCKVQTKIEGDSVYFRFYADQEDAQ